METSPYALTISGGLYPSHDDQSPSERLERAKEYLMRTQLEVFNVMKPTPLLICPMPLTVFKEQTDKVQVGAMELINVECLRTALNEVHKEVASRTELGALKLKHSSMRAQTFSR